MNAHRGKSLAEITRDELLRMRFDEIIDRMPHVLVVGVEPLEIGFTTNVQGNLLNGTIALMAITAIAQEIIDHNCPCDSCQDAIKRARMIALACNATDIEAVAATPEEIEAVRKGQEPTKH